MAEAANAAIRAAARTRRIPEGARCAACGFDNPIALEPWGKRWRCYECARFDRRQATSEHHHILSREVSPVTIETPANLHRVLSDQQWDIPEAIRQAAPHDPLAFIIRLLKTVKDFFVTIAQFLGAAVQWLLRLREWLCEKLGPQWMDDLPPLYPKAAA